MCKTNWIISVTSNRVFRSSFRDCNSVKNWKTWTRLCNWHERHASRGKRGKKENFYRKVSTRLFIEKYPREKEAKKKEQGERGVQGKRGPWEGCATEVQLRQCSMDNWRRGVCAASLENQPPGCNIPYPPPPLSTRAIVSQGQTATL